VPRAQRTKSAVHEALQRRAECGPGVSFTAKLDGARVSIMGKVFVAPLPRVRQPAEQEMTATLGVSQGTQRTHLRSPRG
jgi:hypothetical protein